MIFSAFERLLAFRYLRARREEGDWAALLLSAEAV